MRSAIPIPGFLSVKRETGIGKLSVRSSTTAVGARKNGSLSTLVCRGIAVIVLGTLWWFQQQADAILEKGWQILRTNWLFQHESFEPFLSAGSFFFFIGVWGFLDFFVPSASNNRLFPSDDVSSWFGGTRIRDQTLWYIAPLVILDLIFPRRQLPEAAPSLLRLTLEVVGAIAVYDAAFFAWHATLHSNPTLYRRVHATHHKCRVQRAPEAVRHTFIDGTMDVLCSVFALNVVGCHPLSRAVYDVVIIALITELHAGYDFPWQLHRIVPFELLGGRRGMNDIIAMGMCICKSLAPIWTRRSASFPQTTWEGGYRIEQPPRLILVGSSPRSDMMGERGVVWKLSLSGLCRAHAVTIKTLFSLFKDCK